MLWLALILPELPLQVFSRAATAEDALAITEAQPRPQVIAANPLALAAGVRRGQRIASARAIAPGLRLQARAPALESEALAEIASWAGTYTPRVSLAPPDAVLLEISSSLRLFGGADVIETAVHSGLCRLGFRVLTAFAPTPLAARWFARSLTPPGPGAAWLDRLDSLPLAVLADGTDVRGDTLELLRGIGLATLGEVRRLPAAGLARRQAQAVLAALARARGEHPDPRAWFVTPPRFEREIALPAPTSLTEPLLFAARRLFASLGGWLQGQHAAVDRCRLSLLHEHAADTVLEIVTGRPSRDEARLVMLAREHLAALPLPAEVSGLRLSADNPASLAPRPDDLFGDPARAGESAMLLIDRLRARLGSDTVRQFEPHADHRPDSAWRMTGVECARRTRTDPAGRVQAHTTRPLWLLRAPRRLDPHDFSLLGEAERIESGWWDERDIRRDYYLARGPDDALWWVFHELDPPGHWYVHGYFG